MILKLIISFVISILTVNLSQKLLLKENIVDTPKKRSSHKNIATRNGGIALFAALSVITTIFYIESNEVYDFSILIPLAIFFTIGVYDDIYSADFKLKFIFQIIAAKIMIDQGLYIESLNGFLGIYEIPYLIGQPLSIFLIVLLVNASNFMDGIDGLCLTESLKSFALVAFLLFNQNNGWNSFLIIVCISIIPLYFFNFRNNNKVFLGDAGSLLLGGIVAYSILFLIKEPFILSSKLNIINIILIVYLYPIIDLLRVVILRISKKRSPFIADKNHIHHYILDKGFSQLQATLIISVSTLVLQLTALYALT